ncbi:MAG TPA: MoxR family ATPase [Treponemataceae bacterium]|nr:MoxR family ATPase [Treponemataceae bacterium]
MSDFEWFKDLAKKCRDEVAKRVIGQTQVIDGILTCLICDGHVLLEGVPGLAKTLVVKTFADISGLEFKRIQFTPDLLPADVSGTLIYDQNVGAFSVRKGPVFSNIVLADEINRAPAKVQSALLEAMAEKQVTIGEKTYALPEPFFVLATQNPIEQEGTYTLPEAQLDRFLLKILVDYPSAKEEAAIVTTAGLAALTAVDKVLAAKDFKRICAMLGSVKVDEKIVSYIVSLVGVTRPETIKRSSSIDFLRYISCGASPRGGIALYNCAKVQAMFAGRDYVIPEDVKAAAPSVLRHRLLLSYEAAADGISADDLIAKILALMPVP